MKLLRVVHVNQLCDIVQAVHADELKHSGYKKVLDYCSIARWLLAHAAARSCMVQPRERTGQSPARGKQLE